jgi:hypothetical protein
MGIGDDTAARRLRLLAAEVAEPVARASGARVAVTPVSSPPLNLGIIDHMAASVAEVVAHVRESVPEAAPRPAEDAGVYQWWREGTAHLDEATQQAREAIIYRQSLEHAIARGDHDVVRPHPCPACGCWGLFWDRERRLAACVNRYCMDEMGLSHSWTLAQLAHHRVAAETKLKKSAT